MVLNPMNPMNAPMRGNRNWITWSPSRAERDNHTLSSFCDALLQDGLKPDERADEGKQ